MISDICIISQTLFHSYYSNSLDPPTVRVEKTSLENLEDKKDPATLRCLVDSNPNSTVVWKKEGMEGIFSTEFEIVFSPVTRHTAGTYTCTAENPLGMSKPAFVDVDVKCKYNMRKNWLIENQYF